MPRVSSAPEDAYHFKGGFADGWGEVIDAKSLNFQYPPRESHTQDPVALYLSLEIQRYNDPDFASKSAEQPSEVLLKIQGADKEQGVLTACFPGMYPDGNVELEPTDCGGDLGAEGNTIYAAQDGYSINDKTKYMRFCQSLQEKGFKASILKRTFFPDFIGLRAFFKTETVAKFRADMEADPTIFVVTEIKRFPWESTGKPAKGAGKSKPVPAAAVTAAIAGAPASTVAALALGTGAANGDAASTDVAEIAKAVITKTFKDVHSGQVFEHVNALKVKVLLAANKHKPAVPQGLKKQVNDQLGNIEWLMKTGEDNAVFAPNDEGKIVVF